MSALSVAEAWFGAPPRADDRVWFYIRPEEWASTPFVVVSIDPVAWFYTTNEGALARLYRRAEPADLAIVNRYRQAAQALARTTYLIVDTAAGLPVDGFHRLAAMALEGVRSALALDLSLEAP